MSLAKALERSCCNRTFTEAVSHVTDALGNMRLRHCRNMCRNVDDEVWLRMDKYARRAFLADLVVAEVTDYIENPTR